jgi:uncharacterized membrane protein
MATGTREAQATPTPPRRRRMDPRRALARIAISFVFGAAAYAAAASHMGTTAAALVGWDVAGAALMAISWSTLATLDAAATRRRAGAEDPGRTLVYVIVVLTSAVSLFAATILVRDVHQLLPDQRVWPVSLCLVTVALAWAMTHTAFAFRYARLYYREDREGVGGVELPGHQPMTYFDFAYFAFTIGMCFQVSDACITSRQIRRAALLHAMISFAYNTVILAFVLNLVFSLAA